MPACALRERGDALRPIENIWTAYTPLPAESGAEASVNDAECAPASAALAMYVASASGAQSSTAAFPVGAPTAEKPVACAPIAVLVKIRTGPGFVDPWAWKMSSR